MSTEIVTVRSRLPMPQGLNEVDAGKWRVLCESVFPSAKTSEAILMALDYCRARKLDPFKRPVNIVPMWNKALGKEVETVWPGINEVQTTAARTGQYAGMDEPKFGPDKTVTFKGTQKYKDDGTWKEEALEVTVTYPEWVSVTVYRMIGGVRCPFTEPVFWEEAYARRGKTDVPNDMWAKRPKGQLLKVAKAFSLRAAFPEEGEYTAEEMEGKEIAAGGVVIDVAPSIDPVTGEINKAAPFWKTATLRNSFTKDVQEKLNSAQSKEEVNAVILQVKDKLAGMRAGDSRDELAADSIQNTYRLALLRFATPEPSPISVEDGAMTEEEMTRYAREMPFPQELEY